jgi:hypothetical protein
MRIVIETNEMAAQALTSAPELSVSPDMAALDAGAAPDAVSDTSRRDDRGEDTGGPPQWLLEAINAAEVSVQAESPEGMEDGGAGPADE